MKITERGDDFPARAIILSAGQGRRLLPLTENTPKCLLPVAGKPVIAWQIDALLANGIEEIVIVAGFQIGKVEALIAERYHDRSNIRIIWPVAGLRETKCIPVFCYSTEIHCWEMICCQACYTHKQRRSTCVSTSKQNSMTMI